jgi:gamma-glutamyltranspeptidase/glutathione hydrolase
MSFSGYFFKKATAVAFFVGAAACHAACHAQAAKSYMVAAAHPLAVAAGLEILKRGGNAVDAAIAVQMALGLAEPQASGLGGGAFLLYWDAKGKVLRSYDGRESAPAAARPERFLKPGGQPMTLREAIPGGRSVGVPGALRMLEAVHRRHGKLAWAELFEPALRAAEQGFAMTPRLRGWLERVEGLKDDPEARALYFDAEGKPKATGTTIVNRAYAETLRAIAQGGADAFYRGPIAADIARAVRSGANPGDLTEADLAGYRAIEREPVCGPYRMVRICSMGPPSSGGIAVLQILGLLERSGFDRASADSLEAWHLFAEARRLAFADRAKYLGDPDFIRVPVEGLLKKSYLDERARLIGPRALPGALAGDPETGTSDLAIVDAEGGAVSMTTTIEAPFGSRLMVRGFLLNNELTDFDFVPGGKNQMEAGKRPRSSMAPTIVFDAGGEVRIVIGSAGGAFIIGDVAKALVGMLDWGLGVQAAIDLPNMGGRGDLVEIEQGPAYERFAEPLRALGHKVQPRTFPSGLHAIERVPGGWRGGADRRREGVARGE